MANILLTLPTTLFKKLENDTPFDSYKLHRKILVSVLVLVVEHDAETQKSISLHVEAAGHNCYCATSASEAKSWLESSSPDAVILDLLLPDCDHRQFSSCIQSLAPTAKIIVIARAGSEDAIREALKWGASDYLEKPVSGLRLACVLSHLNPVIPTNPASCYLEDAFFNGDRHRFKVALSKFKKAIMLNIPIVFEGDIGTGKKTAARHFLKQVAPDMPVAWFNARTDSHDDFREHTAKLTRGNTALQHGIVIQHLEAASKALQHDIKALLNTPNTIVIATSRGRLMDHMEQGVLDPVLFSKMSAAPFWLAPLSERAHDAEVIGQFILGEANCELGTNLPISTIVPIVPTNGTGFRDNFHGLKKAIYAAAANRSSAVATLNLVEKIDRVDEISKIPFLKKASIDLTDAAGDIRPLEIIEAEALNFAYHHLDGRVGKIAKALKLSRTTLYRKLIKQKLALPEEHYSNEQNSDFVHVKKEKVTARAA